MTIKEYMARLETAHLQPIEPGDPCFTDSMAETTEIWSNSAAMGYFIHAARLAELDDEAIQKVLGAFHQAFDDLTVDEAEREYTSY